MNRDEISSAASALANQVRAGIPLDQALGRLAILQPRRADFWKSARRHVQSGGRVSEVLKNDWPETYIAAIRAGERANKLPDVLAEIERAIQTEITVVNMMRKLIYPIALVLTGVAIFAGFMLFVIPGLSKSIPPSDWGTVFRLAAAIEVFFKDRFWMLPAGLAAVVFGVYSWVSSPTGRAQILDFVVRLPGLNEATRDLYFGLWANQMALVAGSGISTVSALESTAPTLPAIFRDAVMAVKNDIQSRNINLAEAVDQERQQADDPRRRIPFYVTNAFIVAEQTGEIQGELLRVAPAMLNEGIKTMNKVSGIANVVAMGIAAFLIVLPLGVYYIQVFSVLQKL